ncbi:Gti1/Pac2 family-domain-containing protein [Gautieria morchelliformis]|nr:Gti1/Pac2 family-domain-containing protein [Gautieria morchelliformis]
MQARDDPATVSFYGLIKDHHDALLLITAARLGLIPRFRRRLNMPEQDTLIYSGAVFLWTEEESCMKRWTDGYPWSPSRIHHEFLLYREMAERGCARSRTSSRLATNDASDENVRPHDSRHRRTIRLLAGSLFNADELENLVRMSISGESRINDVFKRGGLMKKTFSLSLPGETWHVISYYTLEDALASRLPIPKESLCFKGLTISKDVQTYHASLARRQSLDTSMQDFTDTLSFTPLYNTSSQVTLPSDLPPEIFAPVSGPAASTDEFLNMLSIPVGDFTLTPCMLPPPPSAYGPPRLAEDKRQNVRDDSNAGWFDFM